MNNYEVNQQLGREFLTWLWFMCEMNDGDLEAPSVGQIALMIDQEVILSDDGLEGGIDILRAPDAAISGEAKAALLSGKKAAQLKLSMARDTDQWLFTLNDRLQCRGARLPTSESEHPADIFKDQMDGVETLGAVIDDLYGQFAVLRLSPGWPAEQKRMRSWVESK